MCVPFICFLNVCASASFLIELIVGYYYDYHMFQLAQDFDGWHTQLALFPETNVERDKY